jgi:two-component system nitrogen regulation response regulator NtrX
MDKKILIIDDEKNILKSLEIILSSENFSVLTATNLTKAREIISKETVQLFLLDVMLKDEDGIAFISEIRDKIPEAIIIMISGHATIKMAVEATQKGADDFLEKPLSKEKILITLNNFVKRLALQQKYDQLEQEIYSSQLIGQSETMLNIIKQIEKVAPTNSKVLITGESGTGKEIVARMIHLKSQRRTEPYSKINCAAIPAELIESELFGNEKGAFTGATERRDGKFALADKGTLLLDEIGDMSLSTQTKVLRVLQEGEFERVGGNETIITDVRIIAATNKDLKKMVDKGTFREDLYFRLHVLPIHIPPLRKRTEDIELLIKHYIKYFCGENNKSVIEIDNAALTKLKEYKWPGNVRELKNMVERMVIMNEGDRISIDQLPPEIIQPSFEVAKAFGEQKTLREVRDEIESEYIKYCLEKFDGNVAKLSEILQIERTYLYKKLKNIGLRK